MLALLSRFAPTTILLIGLALGALPAAGLGWAAHGLKFDWIDKPSIIREATATAEALCALRVSNAATAAEAAERARQRAANADARRAYDAALANSTQLAAAAQTALDQEIADRETLLANEGRSCGFGDGDIEWLYHNGTAPAGSSR